MCRYKYFKLLPLSSFRWRNRRFRFGTSFFYRTVQVRLNYNFIRSFFLPSGVFLTDPQQMSVHAVIHFQKILGPMPAPPVGLISTSAWFHSLTEFICSDSQCVQMTTVPQGSIRALGVFWERRLSNLLATSLFLRLCQLPQMPPSCR